MKIPVLVRLCDKGRLVSPPFIVTSQSTIVALGLQTGDTVDFWIDLITDPVVSGSGPVVLPNVVQSTRLKVNGCDVQLTPEDNWIILDAPQGFLLHAELHPAVSPTIQRVVMNENTTSFLASPS